MTVKKMPRHKLTLSPQTKAVDMLKELATKANRSMTSMMEVLIANAYKEWRSSAGEQLRPDADQ